ncbi:26S protease regulatory subunit 6B [Lates japonicus]|uniref:26S protease regulatory subunit 6B n=1 Tax=Lates japonicus TaxID=270547 RepID=A0AAD3NHI2_LATJO|nr:26S protease regulatory subunit 6B [Lates japonicus]
MTVDWSHANRADTLDPALLVLVFGQKIEFPCLTLDVARPDKISGADINSICQEAGMLAVRENRYIVLAKDFEKAYKTVIKKDEQEHEFYK